MPEPAPAAQRQVLKIGDLVRRLKKLIDDNIRYVWVEGEISEYKVHRPSGHHYFTLKDEETVLNCAMWKGFVTRLDFKPEVGLEVYAFGRLDIYPPRGTYQLIVERMEPKGLGALQLRFEELKKALQAEGLFDPARKRPLPPFPRTVAIVTSPTGAAIRDMLKILGNRFPKISVVIYPVPVQGDGAAGDIARAIGEINLQRPDVEVMIVGRGGGSLEDLWAFNEEIVARAIFRSRIPVVSAVGHETDFTIADFVADARAATPTDAAVRVVPDLREVMEALRQHEEALARRPRERFEQCSQRVDELHARLTDALTSSTRTVGERLDRLGESLHSALPRLTAETRRRLELLAASRGFAAVEHQTSRYRERLSVSRNSLDRELARSRERALDRARSLADRMEALSPLRVLGRGYSITLDAAGRALRDAAKARAGDQIVTRLQKGRIRSRVEESLDPPSPGDTMTPS